VGSIADTSASSDDLSYLRSRQLLVPVANVAWARLPNTFDEARAGGARRHDALDIRAPRGTAVLSAGTRRISKLFTRDAGGLTIYATDPSERFVYYYAHLDRYDPRVREGMAVHRGDTIAYVGTSGNGHRTPPSSLRRDEAGGIRTWSTSLLKGRAVVGLHRGDRSGGDTASLRSGGAGGSGEREHHDGRRPVATEGH
jgi:hypothetical protein